MTTQSRPYRPDVLLLSLYLLCGLPLQVWGYWADPVPFMNYGPPAWPNFPAYAVAGPLAGYLVWRRTRRARFATYVFLTFDIVRAARLAHWLPVALDIAILVYLQTPAMRRLYPSIWSRRKAMWRPWARS